MITFAGGIWWLELLDIAPLWLDARVNADWILLGWPLTAALIAWYLCIRALLAAFEWLGWPSE
jgi:hypothetical protein